MRSFPIVLSALPMLLAGCAAGGTTSACTPITTFGIGSPANRTADHTAAAPGNQVKFSATLTPGAIGGAGCAIPTYIAIVDAMWTTSDPLDTSVSSAADSTNGLATCTGMTSTPATLTATYGTGSSAQSATTTLTCK